MVLLGVGPTPQGQAATAAAAADDVVDKEQRAQ